MSRRASTLDAALADLATALEFLAHLDLAAAVLAGTGPGAGPPGPAFLAGRWRRCWPRPVGRGSAAAAVLVASPGTGGGARAARLGLRGIDVRARRPPAADRDHDPGHAPGPGARRLGHP